MGFSKSFLALKIIKGYFYTKQAIGCLSNTIIYGIKKLHTLYSILSGGGDFPGIVEYIWVWCSDSGVGRFFDGKWWSYIYSWYLDRGIGM